MGNDKDRHREEERRRDDHRGEDHRRGGHRPHRPDHKPDRDEPPPTIRVPQPTTVPVDPVATPSGDLNGAVNALGRMPAVVSGSVALSAPTSTSVDVDGVVYTVTEQRRRVVNDIIEHAFLQDIGAMGVWPGQVIQGRPLLVGDIAPIGPLARQPGKIQIVTDLVSKTPYPQSADVDIPDSSKVSQARRDILNAANPTGSAGMLKTGFERASTLREVGVKLGMTVKGPSFGVDANARLDQTYRSSVVVASIRQILYSVTFTHQSAGATGFWPSNIVSFDDLRPFVGEGNPPLYIDSVQYGRFICITAQGTFSSSEIAAALRASWDTAVSGNVEADARTREVLERLQVKIYTIGVSDDEDNQFRDITDPVSSLRQVYTNGLRFTLENLGAPVSFTCRHIADNTFAHVGLAAEYIQPLSAQGEDISQRRFEVFDGPGGGLVDTGITVNPGDTVTVSASGQIDSGVWLSQPHGPEGWPGHTADPNAPLPGERAYCLLVGFGNQQWNWTQAWGVWSGQPPAGSGGRLLLNINDNNPRNGNPRYRWTVFVDVKRRGAAAAGVYIS